MRTVRNVLMWAVVGLAIALVGCNDPKKNTTYNDQASTNLQEWKDSLEKWKNLAEGLKAQNQQDQNTINALRRELDALRNKQSETQLPPGWVGVPGGAMIAIEGTVLFDSGKAELKPGSKKTLAQIAETIKQTYPDREIYIFGHTDSEAIRKSKWRDNYELSCHRSLAVVRFLQGSGTGNYMAACGWGEHRPVTSNHDKASMQANRRVEIFAMTPTGAGAPAAHSTGK